jgi:hypothetical protein
MGTSGDEALPQSLVWGHSRSHPTRGLGIVPLAEQWRKNALHGL